MRSVFLKLLIFELFFLNLVNFCSAETNSYQILVSCTIPAIPGINVPKNSNSTGVKNKQKEVKMEVKKQGIFLQKEEKVKKGNFVLLLTSIYAR